MICHALLILSILVSAAVVGEGGTAAYDPTDVFLFNCGETSDQTDTIGRKWTAENRKILSSNSVSASFILDALHQESGVPQIPYMKARIFRSESTYSFPVSPGWKFIRLYFYPTRYESYFDAVDSFFAVTVNGFTLLRNFSADLTVKASKGESTLIKEFIVPVNQPLNLTFTPSSVTSFAFVNGIEIVSMPDRFYSKGGFDNMVNKVGSDVGLEINNSTAFETVYRLNVGGNMVDEVGDSGMFRRWLFDYDYFVAEGISPLVPNVKINYTEKTPAYVAPEDVYATCRTRGVQNPKLYLDYNLTWLFTVDAGFNYLIRLHFCEIMPEVNASGQRIFSIFLENQTAKKDMDVIWLSGGSQIPMYLDFSVYVGFESGPRPDLRLDLHPFKDIAPMYYDAILNGVEILKLNNSDGNLAGHNPNPPLSSYDPTDVFLFNCGDTSDKTDNIGRNWTADDQKIITSNSVNADALHQESGVPQVPYLKARMFLSNFTYSFPISPGWKFIRLYFYPTRYESYFDAVDSFFAVTVNGFTILRNFSADLTVKASKEKTIIKEFIVPVKRILNLTFTPSLVTSFAFVNGIEIVSMPDRFYSKGGFDNMVNNGSDVGLKIDNSTAFETVYRLNVGGNMVHEVHDSGMFRRWLSDDKYFHGADGIIPYVTNVMINYTEKTPAYVAPEDVYATCRTMGNVENPKLNLDFNLTWLFTVDAGFNYIVRLHFCEILPRFSAVGQRIFSIFLENQMAKEDMDVIWLSGGSRTPMYLDFSVYVGSESGPRPDLRLALYPLKEIAPKYYVAILNGVEILKLNKSDGNLAGPNPNPPLSWNLTPNRVTLQMKDKSHVPVIIFIAVGSTIGLATFIVVLMLSIRQMKRKRGKENSNIMFKVLLKHYTYTELKKITKSFSHTDGKGGFGTVYGGYLCNGYKVAVKVLKDSKGNGEDFINEVASMSQTSHVNIVSLLGFCYEGSKRAIVYEFLENGSLDQFMSRKDSLTLDVTTLYGIALGIARGLEYLHYGCKTRIVHFDIKPQNILLDENLCPKVSDFGLAKLCEKRESIFSLIDGRGTIGYIAPEVFSRMYGRVSHKSDVYSYGMLVLEMIGARNKKIVGTIDSAASSTYFPDWIYKDLEEGEQTWIFGDEITIEEKEIARKMILICLWCIQPCPSDRPPMNRVVEMIEGSVDALEIPPKPSMHISSGLIAESSSFSDCGEAE